MNIFIPQVSSHRHIKSSRDSSRDGNSKKLIVIAAMFLVIGYLVWTIG